MSADDIFGPETDDEKAQAKGHPLTFMFRERVAEIILINGLLQLTGDTE